MPDWIVSSAGSNAAGRGVLLPSFRIARHPEAEVDAFVAAVVAIGQSQFRELRRHPARTANRVHGARGRPRRIGDRWAEIEIERIRVVDPLAHIATHVIEAESIRAKGTGWGRNRKAVLIARDDRLDEGEK